MQICAKVQILSRRSCMRNLSNIWFCPFCRWVLFTGLFREAFPTAKTSTKLALDRNLTGDIEKGWYGTIAHRLKGPTTRHCRGNILPAKRMSSLPLRHCSEIPLHDIKGPRCILFKISKLLIAHDHTDIWLSSIIMLFIATNGFWSQTYKQRRLRHLSEYIADELGISSRRHTAWVNWERDVFNFVARTWA